MLFFSYVMQQTKKVPTAFTVAGSYLTLILPTLWVLWGKQKKKGKNINMLGEVFRSDLFLKTPVLLGAEGLQSSFLFFLSFRSFLFGFFLNF